MNHITVPPLEEAEGRETIPSVVLAGARGGKIIPEGRCVSRSTMQRSWTSGGCLSLALPVLLQQEVVAVVAVVVDDGLGRGKVRLEKLVVWSTCRWMD